MLGDLQTDDQIKHPADRELDLQIADLQKCAVANDIGRLQPRTVDAAYIVDASALQYRKPGPDPATDIQYRLWL